MKIRTQLTLVVTAVVALVVALSGLVIVVRNDHRDRDEVDRVLAAKAATVRAAAVKTGALPTDGTYVVRLVSDGKLRKQAGGTTSFPLTIEDGYSIVEAGDTDWRSFSEVLVGGAQMQILVSLATLKERHTDNVLVVDLLVVLAALLSALGVWFATGLMLRPFQRLLAAARDLGPDERLPEVTSPPEVAQLATALNDLLDRVRSATPTPTPTPTPAPAPAPVAQVPVPVPEPIKEPEPVPEPIEEPQPELVTAPAEDLLPHLDGLGANLDTLMDYPDMPATQRHLILAAMADDHRAMVARLKES
jgi:hypothetical protein